MITLTAHFNRTGAAGATLASERFATRAEAEAWTARFAKSHGFKTIQVSGPEVADTYYAEARINLVPNAATGAVNETGVRRYRAIVKKAAALGEAIEFTQRYANSFASREDFEAAL